MEAPERFSGSTRLALRWAWGAARLRAARYRDEPFPDPSSSPGMVDMFDLLFGICMFNPDESEASILLKHFGLTLRDVMPDLYPTITAADIRDFLPAGPLEEVPLNSECEEIVSSSIYQSDFPDEPGGLRPLFGLLIRETNVVRDALASAIEVVGGDFEAVAGTYEEFLKANPGTYREFLAERLPFTPVPVSIPDYKADRISAAPGANRDLIDIRGPVDAFAYLFASRGLAPPLAVGLFGDWGSGKSFFMTSIRDRISRLVGDEEIRGQPQKDLPFWKNIVQIEFNAWHYVEGNLWASLVEHIFRNLKSLPGDEADVLARREKYYVEQLNTLRQAKDQVEVEKKRLEGALKNVTEEADRLRGEHQEKLKDIQEESEKRANYKLDPATGKNVAGLIAGVLDDSIARTAKEYQEEIDRAREELHSFSSSFRPLMRDRRTLAAAVLSLVLLPLISWAVSLADTSAVVQAVSGMTGALTAGLVAIRSGTDWLSRQNRKLLDARKRVQDELEEADRKYQSRITDLQVEAATKETELNTTLEREQSLKEEIQQLESDLSTISPARFLRDFLEERVGSDDYRKQLGVAALIRQDFEELSKLIEKQNEGLEKGTVSEDSENLINRIVLYIDDLDRCPVDKVISVLQAVHLLLAFDIFVVVVAVDSRWLSHSLISHYSTLVEELDGTRATPRNYLEKIFQIPYWISPIDDDSKADLVRGLLAANLEREQADDAQGVADDDERVVIDERHLEFFDEMFQRGGGVAQLKAATLTVTPEELSMLESFGPLLGDTPRSVKRFVNIYQLAKTAFRFTEDEQPENAIFIEVSGTQLLGFMLAACNGMPDEASKFLDRIEAEAQPGLQLLPFLDTYLTEAGCPAPVQNIKDWLDDPQQNGGLNWGQTDTGRLLPMVPRLRRFLFSSSRSRASRNGARLPA